jgi:hypothetical protein
VVRFAVVSSVRGRQCPVGEVANSCRVFIGSLELSYQLSADPMLGLQDPELTTYAGDWILNNYLQSSHFPNSSAKHG